MPGRRECPAWTRRCGGRSRRRGGARSCPLHPSMLVALVSLCGTVAWNVRELAARETHDLRRRVSADGRTDLTSFAHPLDELPSAWHLGATGASGRVVAISS